MHYHKAPDPMLRPCWSLCFALQLEVSLAHPGDQGSVATIVGQVFLAVVQFGLSKCFGQCAAAAAGSLVHLRSSNA